MSCWNSDTITLNDSCTGWPQSRKKIPRVFQAFPEPQTYFSIGYRNKKQCNNDLRQGSFHINSSNITGRHLLDRVATPWDPNDPVYPDNSCFTQIFEWWTKNTLFVYNFSLRLHRIPWVFHVQRNPGVFQFPRFVATLDICQQQWWHS